MQGRVEGAHSRVLTAAGAWGRLSRASNGQLALTRSPTHTPVDLYLIVPPAGHLLWVPSRHPFWRRPAGSALALLPCSKRLAPWGPTVATARPRSCCSWRRRLLEERCSHGGLQLPAAGAGVRGARGWRGQGLSVWGAHVGSALACPPDRSLPLRCELCGRSCGAAHR